VIWHTCLVTAWSGPDCADMDSNAFSWINDCCIFFMVLITNNFLAVGYFGHALDCESPNGCWRQRCSEANDVHCSDIRRLIDGREAVFFLRRIKDVVEDPRRLLLDV
jgi:hypothetical protein